MPAHNWFLFKAAAIFSANAAFAAAAFAAAAAAATAAAATAAATAMDDFVTAPGQRFNDIRCSYLTLCSIL